jgi:hypothetical protein
MKSMNQAFRMLILVACALGAWALAGCAATKGAPDKTNCNAKIKWEVTAEAKLTRFDCELGTHEGQPALIFNVGLENPTDKPYRYRVQIFLEDMDKAFGALVPAKGNPPVLEPGKAGTAKLPFIGVDKESKKILVVVKTIGI